MLCTAGRKTLFRPETAAPRLAALAIVVVPGVGVALRRLDASLAAVAAWGVRHVRLLARSFVGAGFTVVVADLLTAETLPRYRAGPATGRTSLGGPSVRTRPDPHGVKGPARLVFHSRS